ncbi:transcription factor MafB [Daktulosphaira vitifoliae]|uniref:transcription factor MafB n=1 Tax=Daktulosphaira vitifoliae TaxID=58002 RepID=UPI0021AAA425|nr:transcription factor MafB [Daktulosphaira vitifoliae]XP_050527290.1 transcription factor MafB [Daktulosphaira vitifoliae]
MDADDPRLADEYVQDFELDHLDVVASGIKRETNDYQRRLPSMPIIGGGAAMVQSPPPHYLLTPPGCEQEYSVSHHHHSHHHPGMLLHGYTPAGVLITAGSAVKVSGTGSMIYPNTPGTPPDTPPVSSSPPAATPIRQSNYMDNLTVWLSHLKDGQEPMPQTREGQEPLDLKTNYAVAEEMQQQHHNHHPSVNAVAVAEWNMAQHQHDTVIQPSNGGCLGVRPYGRHQQVPMSPSPSGGGGIMHQMHRSMSVSSDSVMSPMSSRGGCPRGDGSTDELINDTMLLQLPVRDLNKKLQGVDKELVNKLKQKRRTLKNRGYAQSCRTKRMNQRIELENANHALVNELQKIKMELARVTQERDMYKQRCSALTNARESMNAAATASTNSNSNSPELYL